MAVDLIELLTTTMPTTIIKNKYFEFNFILFPVWIGILYILTNRFISISEELVFFIFLVILGETHFASTYLFFFEKSNYEWIRKHYITMIVTPIILLVVYVIIGFQSIFLAIFVGQVFSAFHVTRQSIGIQRLYGTRKRSFFELLIYFFSFLFLFIGFLRFFYNDLIAYLNLPLPSYTDDYNLYFLPLIAVPICFFNNENYKKVCTTLTGVLLYSPYVFVGNVYEAAIIGVGAHWCQYLAINYKVYFSQNTFKNVLKTKVVYLLIFIVLYSIIMSITGYKINFYSNDMSLLILIPLSGQLLHYYLDAFIWRFSDNHIRENIGKKLFA